MCRHAADGTHCVGCASIRTEVKAILESGGAGRRCPITDLAKLLADHADPNRATLTPILTVRAQESAGGKAGPKQPKPMTDLRLFVLAMR
jgi:hypothetical protein